VLGVVVVVHHCPLPQFGMRLLEQHRVYSEWPTNDDLIETWKQLVTVGLLSKDEDIMRAMASVVILSVMQQDSRSIEQAMHALICVTLRD
jgi:hypothetical protein